MLKSWIGNLRDRTMICFSLGLAKDCQQTGPKATHVGSSGFKSPLFLSAKSQQIVQDICEYEPPLNARFLPESRNADAKSS